MASPTLNPIEAALVDTVRLALMSSPGALRQYVQRLAKNPPTDANKVEVQAQLSALLAAAPPDNAPALRRSQPAQGLPAPLPPRSSDLPRRDGAVRVGTGRMGGDSQVSPVPHLIARNPETRPTRPVWSPAIEASIDELVQQRRNAPLLAQHGLVPAAKVLFVGPPGVGKTMTAGYLADELGLPFVAVDPTTVMSSYLGNSAKNLREVLDYARHEECVVFFDEFDALAKSRDDAQDIGEVKRFVNSLLLELDRSHLALVVAATNFDRALDSAIHRRFDTRIEFALPGVEERRRLVAQHPALVSFGAAESLVSLLALATHNWSPSDIERHLNAVTRSAILTSRNELESLGPLHEVADWGVRQLNSSDADPDTRREIASVAVNVMRYSHRQAAELLGVTHPTIAKWLKTA